MSDVKEKQVQLNNYLVGMTACQCASQVESRKLAVNTVLAVFVYFQLYYELYEQEKERYEQEMREYTARDTVVYTEDSVPMPAREGAIPSLSLQMKKERD